MSITTIRSISNRKSNYKEPPAMDLEGNILWQHGEPTDNTEIGSISADISFYRAYGSEVYIDRILYARRDYMRILFGDSTTDK